MMVKIFFVFITLISGVFLTLLLLPYKQDYPKQIEALSGVTKIPSIAYGGSFLEYRVSLYDDESGRLYPQMSNYKTREFVYAP